VDVDARLGMEICDPTLHHGHFLWIRQLHRLSLLLNGRLQEGRTKVQQHPQRTAVTDLFNLPSEDITIIEQNNQRLPQPRLRHQ
jgi:hypothetical protein